MKKLSAYNISKSYDNKEIIKDTSLEIYEGELVCLLGVSGVGKTTLFNILSGLFISPASFFILYYFLLKSSPEIVSSIVWLTFIICTLTSAANSTLVECPT